MSTGANDLVEYPNSAEHPRIGNVYFNSNNGNNEASEPRTYFGFSKKQWSTLIVFVFVNVFSATVINLQAPFYPMIAEEKGASKIEIGFVFGCFEFIVFVLSPVFGKYIDRLGPKRVFNTGILITAACSVAFGLLTYVENRAVFVTMSFMIRIAEAVGVAGHVTATFTLIALQFPNHIFSVFGSMETCSGIGVIIGPLLGSILYEAGSGVSVNFQFLLPFMTVGGILFIGALLAYFVMPIPVNATKLEQNLGQADGHMKQGLRKLFKIPSFSLAAFSIFAAAVSLGFNAPTLEPHIDQFGLKPVSKGAVFIINGGTYAVSAPLIGKICDRTSNPKIITLIGGLFIFSGFMLIGPAPFLPFGTILWVTCLGLLIQGLGLSCCLVSGFTQAMQDSIDAGFPDDVSTYGLVSGLWMSMFALGNCVGPSVAGLLTHISDYRHGSLLVIALQAVVIGVSFAFVLNSNKPAPSSGQKKTSAAEIRGNDSEEEREAKANDKLIKVPPTSIEP